MPKIIYKKNIYKIAKNQESINWQQCNIELFKLQNEILKAYRTETKKTSGIEKKRYFILI